MYHKLGFKKLDSFEMRIPERGGDVDDLSAIYKEVCMVWCSENPSSSVA